MEIKAGNEYRVKFPFYRKKVLGDTLWAPGCAEQFLEPDSWEKVADGEGELILTVVDVHKPASYPTRVFFTRSWVDPDGVAFSKNKLHIATLATFKRRATSYYYDYRLLAE